MFSPGTWGFTFTMQSSNLGALRRLLRLSTAAAAIALASATYAADTTIGSGQTSGSVELGNGESLTNNGTIIDSTNDSAVRGLANVGTITNAAGGLIQASGPDSHAIWIDGGATAIVNNGRITGTTSSNDDITIRVGGNVGSFVNTGTITASNTSYDSIFLGGAVGSFVNAAGATISGSHFGVHTIGVVDSFSNAGTITGDSAYAIFFSGLVRSFSNTGLINTLNTGGTAVTVDAGVTTFSNAGTITGSNREAVLLRGAIGTFSNSGRISNGSAVNAAVKFDNGVTTIINAQGGTITSSAQRAVESFGQVQSFSNAGTISGASDTAVAFGYGVKSFVNEAGGVIQNTNGSAANSGLGVFVQTSTALAPTGMTFVNRGTITGASNQQASSGVVVFRNTVGGPSQQVASFANSGTISGVGTGVYFDNGVQSFENSGTIASSGAVGVAILGSQGTTFTNSGTIRGATAAVSFGSGNDRLNLLTGSQIYGALAFGSGSDTLDFSGFAGNALLTTSGLETLVSGNRSFVATSGNAQVAIIDIAGTNNAAIGSSFGSTVQAINDIASQNLRTPVDTPAEPSAYASMSRGAAADATEQAVLTQLDTGSGATVWGNVIGGFNAGRTAVDPSSVFGGIVAGSHARVGTMTLGGLVGYVQSNSTALSGQQTLNTQTGLLGVYGTGSVGVVTVDASLVGGVSTHAGKRQFVAGGTLETATGSFTSTFLAPSLGVSIPVLSGDLGQLSVRAAATYVGGFTSAYTETGSSMNLSVGQQTISLLDLRLGLEARHDVEAGEGRAITLTAKAGVSAQSNFGSSTVPVTVTNLNLGTSVATPGGTTYGVYGGLGLETAITESLSAGVFADGSLRNDGVASGTLRLSLTGAL